MQTVHPAAFHGQLLTSNKSDSINTARSRSQARKPLHLQVPLLIVFGSQIVSLGRTFLIQELFFPIHGRQLQPP